MKMIIKIHKGADGSKVIAVCDSDILGKRFEEKSLQLDLASNFYRGEEKDGKFLLDEIRKRPCHLNVVGKKSVDFCMKNGMIIKDHIILIKKVPHAQAIITE